MRRFFLLAALAVGLTTSGRAQTRPFGTLREQADLEQRWLDQRLTTVLPGLMRKYGIDMWVLPMREYNEDPVFSSLVSPTTFAARRMAGPQVGPDRRDVLQSSLHLVK